MASWLRYSLHCISNSDLRQHMFRELGSSPRSQLHCPRAQPRPAPHIWPHPPQFCRQDSGCPALFTAVVNPLCARMHALSTPWPPALPPHLSIIQHIDAALPAVDEPGRAASAAAPDAAAAG